jgi:CHAT domain-containing protein/tetratricopeptide (TPR) repeat protein
MVSAVYPLTWRTAEDAYAKFDYARAIPAYQSALDLAEHAHNAREAARCLRALGLCQYRQGKMTEAAGIFQKALERANESGEPLVKAQVWRGIHLVRHWMGDFKGSLAAGEESLKFYRQVGDPAGIAGQIVNNGTTYMAMGDERRAAAAHREALEIAEGAHDNVNMRFALKNLAVVYLEQGDEKLALSFLERALAITDPPEDERSIGNSENIMGLILHRLHREEEARRAIERGLALARKARDQRLESTLLSAHASILRSLNDMRGAVAALLRCIEISEPLHLYVNQIYTLGEVAERYVELNEPATALGYAEQGVALARRVNSAASSWWPLQSLGRAYTALGRRAEAEAAYAESISVIERWNAQIAGGDSDGRKFFEQRGRSYSLLLALKLQDGDVEAALQLAEQAKARRLGDVLAGGRARITQAMTEEEKQQEQKLAREVARLNTGKAQKEFEAASRALEAFRAELYSAHPELQVHRGEAPPARVSNMQALVTDGRTLLVEYVVLADTLAIFTIERGADGVPKAALDRVAMKRSDLDERVAAFRERLASRDPEYRAGAQALHRTLLGPIHARLAGKANVVIVPDGVLWNLPFHALVDDAGRHAIERFAISYAPSLTVLRESLRAKPVNGNLLAIGAPRGNLPNASAEVRELGKLYGEGSTVLTGAQATDARWREMAPRSGILHLATHGVLNAANPMFSYLEVAGGEVEARELLDLELHASLAVLSGCETARGELRNGEGVVGLAWAMMIAGVPSVVVSQWKVDSASTTELMLAFHRALRGTGATTKAGALRTAAVQLMKRPEYRHPFYWAGFHLLGNGL